MSQFANFLLLIVASTSITTISGNYNIFLWSDAKFDDVPTLKRFDDDSLTELRNNLQKRHLAVFKGGVNELNSLSHLFDHKTTAYIANGYVDNENNMDFIDLTDGNAIELIANETARLSNDYVGMIVVEERKRERRESKTATETAPHREDDEYETERPPGVERIATQPDPRPIAYVSPDKHVIVYSSRQLVLTVNASKYYLGDATGITLDTRNNFMRLCATIVNDDKEKIILRFKFVWLNDGYWSFPSVELEYTDSRKYNLSLADDERKELLAARNFSYHCSGNTTFSDPDDGFELTLYDLQAQPDAVDGVFGDAYDCVPFTTVPILSGVFVVTLLLIVLAIGLNALGSIKITQGCENVKLKELGIAFGE